MNRPSASNLYTAHLHKRMFGASFTANNFEREESLLSRSAVDRKYSTSFLSASCLKSENTTPAPEKKRAWKTRLLNGNTQPAEYSKFSYGKAARAQTSRCHSNTVFTVRPAHRHLPKRHFLSRISILLRDCGYSRRRRKRCAAFQISSTAAQPYFLKFPSAHFSISSSTDSSEGMEKRLPAPQTGFWRTISFLCMM